VRYGLQTMPGQKATRPINTVQQRRRKSTQRERLLTGVVAVANREGYGRVNVSAVIRQAGVSRPTFYEYFTDKDDCFLAALHDIQRRLMDDLHRTVSGHPTECAMQAAIRTLVEFASTRPAMARFLMSESLAGGARALDVRDDGIAEIERIIESSYTQLAPTASRADVSPRAVIGGVYRLLGSRLRRGEPRLSVLLEDLLGWVNSYNQPLAEHRWRAAKAAPPPAPSSFIPPSPMRAPPPLRPGRPRLSEAQVAANHRQRILFAAAQLAESKGYTAMTIAEITKLAGVDGRAFYALFADKQDVFLTFHELGFQEIMAVTAGAFFAGASWPERSWEAGRAFLQFLEQNPPVAHIGFIEAYAAGPGAIQRVEDSHVAFGIFLQEGYQYAPRADPPSRVALEAIITTIFELIYRKARAEANPQVGGLLAQLTFLWLAPFTGPGQANELIDHQLSTTRAQ
jgi:AcrR family transcriptional regulator